MENNTVAGLRKRPRSKGRTVPGTLKNPTVRTEERDGEEVLVRNLQFVTEKGDMIRPECSVEAYNYVFNKLTREDPTPGLHHLAKASAQVFLEKDGEVELAVAIDLIPNIDQSGKSDPLLIGDGERRTFLFDVDQATGGFRLDKIAKGGTLAQVRRIIAALGPLETIEVGYTFEGGRVVSVAGTQVEVVATAV